MAVLIDDEYTEELIRVLVERTGESVDEAVKKAVRASLERLDFTPDELAEIDRHATDSDINLWAESSKT